MKNSLDSLFNNTLKWNVVEEELRKFCVVTAEQKRERFERTSGQKERRLTGERAKTGWTEGPQH